jgi:hypothetical protein
MEAETWISGRRSDLKPCEFDDASMSSEPVPRRQFVPLNACQPRRCCHAHATLEGIDSCRKAIGDFAIIDLWVLHMADVFFF